jgi:formylglycine-generating enzyme required for sulfatase activity
MGKYDVTVGQYCEFLNAVAKTDTYGLYNYRMGLGVFFPTVGIAQSGSSGNYSYSIVGNYSQGANCPIFAVNWGSAARFCNWLQNGQPAFPVGTPGEVASSTETGAYTLNGDTHSFLETRNPGATYFIPSENEWYKAAYYKGGSTNAGYWAYPTQSDDAPGNVFSSSGTNNANYYNNGYSDATNYLTPVGAFSASPGPYGTFDMGGDVFQWNEAVVSPYRGLRGGSYSPFLNSSCLASSPPSASCERPWGEYDDVGFRVASVPEPASFAMLLAGIISLLGYAWQRRERAT